jgi:hypothetical protein
MRQVPKAPPPPAPEFRGAIREELDRLCASEAFRQSRQAARLLRHLVENSIEGNDEALRERAIGSQVFGREARYDTNEDSIVRVGVADVRRRLARYYHEADPRPLLQFAIPVGSYRVDFQFQEQPHPVVPPPIPKSRRRWWALGAAAAAAASAAAWLWWPVSAIDVFWGPALRDPGSVVILAPHPIVYTFSRETFRRFEGQAQSHTLRQIEPLSGPPDATIRLADIVEIRDQYVGLGSAHTIGSLSALFAVKRKSCTIRFGGDFSFRDIRDTPSVLIGFTNRWMLQMTEDLRFILSESGGVPEILDRTTGKTWPLRELRPNGRTPEDYAIVSRLFHPKTGRIMVAVAGITQYGTQAAGEFVTDGPLLEEAVRAAPAGWGGRNVQILLHVPIVEAVPGRPTIVAAHFW